MPLLLTLALAACGGDDDGAADAGPGADAAAVDATPLPLGLTLLDYSIAVDVTPDGRIAVFERLTESEVKLVFYDTLTGVGVEKTSVGDPSKDLATGVAATGRVSALHGVPVQAGLYDEAGGWLDLGSPFPSGCDQDVAAAFDISSDGHVVVGLAWEGCSPAAFRWSDAGGSGEFAQLERLGEPAEGSALPPVNRASVVSDDGQVAAGFAQRGNVDRSPALWQADGSGELLEAVATEMPGEVLSINADGSVLAGQRGQDGFVWTPAGGFVDLVRFDVALPTDPVFPNAMTADGTFVFGSVGDAFFGVPIGFVWSQAGGMVQLAAVATAAGISIPEGVTLGSVLAASADGTVLIGTAMDAAFAAKTFVLVLPAGALE